MAVLQANSGLLPDWPRLTVQVQALSTEVSIPHLEAQGCSAPGMHDRVDELFGRVARPQLDANTWTYELGATSAWAPSRPPRPRGRSQPVL